jgi:hypothetical protein
VELFERRLTDLAREHQAATERQPMSILFFRKWSYSQSEAITGGFHFNSTQTATIGCPFTAGIASSFTATGTSFTTSRVLRVMQIQLGV